MTDFGNDELVGNDEYFSLYRVSGTFKIYPSMFEYLTPMGIKYVLFGNDDGTSSVQFSMVRVQACDACCIPNLWNAKFPWWNGLNPFRGVCHKSMDCVAALIHLVLWCACVWRGFLDEAKEVLILKGRLVFARSLS